MKFTEALPLLLAGTAMERLNDYNVLAIYIVKGSIDLTESVIAASVDSSDEDTTSSIPFRYFEPGDKGTTTRLPRFDAKMVGGNTLTGWTPTLVDLLADDWVVFPDAA